MRGGGASLSLTPMRHPTTGADSKEDHQKVPEGGVISNGKSGSGLFRIFLGHRGNNREESS